MSKPGPGPSTISQGSLLELKAITAEHADRLAKEGRSAVRGARSQADKLQQKERDPFLRPSPGLVKRLAREARNDAKRRVFADEGVDDDTRRAILEVKARTYEALARGDLSGFSERELAEANIDFEAKAGAWSDHSSDVDESAVEARDPFDTLDDLEEVEYVDEMGRTRRGTRREAREAEREREKEERRRRPVPVEESSYASVKQSHLIHGDQSFFPVYQPDSEVLKRKYLEMEREARQQHYDSTKEVRTRGAGAYQFSLDEEKRKEQMAALEAERLETEVARARAGERAGRSVAQEAKRRRLDERRALVEAKRAQLLGGRERLAQLRAQRQQGETEKFFAELDEDIRRSESPVKRPVPLP